MSTFLLCLYGFIRNIIELYGSSLQFYGNLHVYIYICFNNLTAPIGHCIKVIMNELKVVPAAGFDQSYF